jgi:predicted nucleic acid-binding protein
VTGKVVVDGSVSPKWFFPENSSSEALALLRADAIHLLAPAFIAVEFASVLVSKARRGELSPVRAAGATRWFLELGIERVEDSQLVADAIDLATAYHPSLYDCLYAALALREQCPVVTADRPFYDALAAPFPQTMLWIDDLPAWLAS